MGSKLHISIILPVFNEEQNLPKLLHDIKDFFSSREYSYQVVAVNDGSFDNTAAVLNSLSQDLPIKVIEHATNLGYSQSIRSGFKYLDSSDLVLIMDADNQFHIESLDQLTPYISSFDIVVGERVKRKDSQSRILLGEIWSLLGRILFKTKLKDLNCGFKLFSVEILQSLQLDTVGPGINLEIFSDPIVRNSKIKMVPIPHYARAYGVETGAQLQTIRASMVDFYIVMKKRWFK